MRKNTNRYLLYGVLFGLLFPLVAIPFDVLFIQRKPISVENLLQAVADNPLLWIIATAPIFLGLFSSFAGRRQDQIEMINTDLEKKIDERQQMVTKLVALQNDLERQVEIRTADIERRKNQVETAATVAQEATAIRELEDLLEQTTILISNKFGFYHAGIFLIDDRRKHAVLRAASSLGGERMLAQSHKLEIGVAGIVGYVAAEGKPRIALDVGTDAVYFDNPDLPETRSELAIPLMSRGVVIGVLDVQSKEPNAFDEEDIKILQIIGDQVTVAIESANLITEKDAALVAMDRAYQELTKKSWKQTFESEQQIGYRCNAEGRVTYVDSTWDQGLIKAAETGEVYDDASNTLSIPLTIWDQVVGAMSFRKGDTTGHWTEDEISLVQTLTDQVSDAMDSARLYMDTQRRADRERMVADITTKIRESNDPKVILKTAVQELQTALKANRAKFSFESVSVGSSEPVPNETKPVDNTQGDSEEDTHYDV